MYVCLPGLASQSITLLSRLLPDITAALSKLLPPAQQILLNDVSKVSQDLSEHNRRLMGKCVGIMQDVVDGAFRQVDSVAWNKPGPTPSAMMSGVLKGFTTLYKILSQVLLPSQTQVS